MKLWLIPHPFTLGTYDDDVDDMGEQERVDDDVGQCAFYCSALLFKIYMYTLDEGDEIKLSCYLNVDK